MFWDINLVIKCIGIKNIYKVILREKLLKKNHQKIFFTFMDHEYNTKIQRKRYWSIMATQNLYI